ncbi:3-dehydroquinate dehydratase [Caldithrix abyssi DSM 13497]|uniref:3-dehydroquinate dehydratase n=1 Tax=Caldithrix abyssi DSM 13497 TaxID=880073 RepID=H1XNZ4_CALAY|nr:type II 3-dehydroquinate dehydratase [Caldithrix abyssi]APF20490.1 aroQ 3-dehydroquinate dehydratase [Caldithrix abyssi DSM 13497]EHO40986.1 3-dehydroquinate dehydratase [Caldithrix abyssi DSM 13497]
MKILVIHGPNLNLLGQRNPEIYGTFTLEQLNQKIKNHFPELEFEFFQSNHEGQIIDRIHLAREASDGIVINAGALTHYSYSLRDAIEATPLPVVEVHLSNIFARESFRKNSVISEVCLGTVSGFGAHSYLLGVEALKEHLKQ